MKYLLNQAAVDHAKTLIIKSMIDDGPWLEFDFIPAQEFDDTDVASSFGLFQLGILEGSDGTETAHYAFPIARDFFGDTPRVSIAALRLIRYQAGHIGSSDIFLAADSLLTLATGNQLSSNFTANIEELDPDGFWVEILKTGTWQGSQGPEITLTTADLDDLVTTFNATYPLVKPTLRLGDHPGNGEGIKPQVGSVSALKTVGDKLLGYFSEVPKIVKEAIEKNLFSTCSSGLWRDWKVGETRYPRLLNHVAILGAELPAVQGLADLQAYLSSAPVSETVVCLTQAKEEDNDMEFKELYEAEVKKNKDLDAELATLKQENTTLSAKVDAADAASAKIEVEKVVDDAISEGKILPVNKEDQIATGIALRNASVNLSAGTADPYDNWKATLEKAGKVINLSEKSETGDAAENLSEFEKEKAEGAAATKANIEARK